MIRVVADTNIYISGVMFGGLPGAFLDLAILGAFTLVASAALLDELDEKLRLKFLFTSEDAAAIAPSWRASPTSWAPGLVLSVIDDDPDDNRVLECAIAGQADYMVSGDRHLLKLKTSDMPIMTVRQFLDAIDLERLGDGD